jgi:hypothetical protein
VKKLSLIVVAVLSLVALNASAQSQCDNYISAGGFVGGPVSGPSWMYYKPASCWSTSGNVSQTTLYCSTGEGWQFGFAWLNTPATTTTSFYVPSSYYVINPNGWTVDSHLQVSSPDSSWYDHMEINVDVQHPDNTHSYYNSLIWWNGMQGDDNGCQFRDSDTFTANAGDTINVTVTSVNPSGGATMYASTPIIWNH